MKKKKPAKPKLGYTNPEPIPDGSIVMIHGKLHVARGLRLGLTKRDTQRIMRGVRKLCSDKPLVICP